MRADARAQGGATQTQTQRVSGRAGGGVRGGGAGGAGGASTALYRKMQAAGLLGVVREVFLSAAQLAANLAEPDVMPHSVRAPCALGLGGLGLEGGLGGESPARARLLRVGTWAPKRGRGAKGKGPHPIHGRVGRALASDPEVSRCGIAATTPWTCGLRHPMQVSEPEGPEQQPVEWLARVCEVLPLETHNLPRRAEELLPRIKALLVQVRR